MSLSSGPPVDKPKSEQARLEGNTAFKRGKWVDSIGHYTNAILHNPDDPVAYCNRAQAYLRIDKFSDAERDCTSALEKQPQNIKALYRRGIARRGLKRYDEALTDLNEVLKIDASSEAALEESDEIRKLLDEKEAQAKHRRIKDFRDVTAPKARSCTVTTNHHSDAHSSIDDDSAERPLASFAALKKARETKKTAHAAGSLQTPATASSAAPTPIPRNIPRPPTDPNSTRAGTGILLVRAMTPLNPSKCWALISQYPPENLPLILGPILEPDSLGRVVMALQQAAENELGQVAMILRGLRSTARIKMNVAMLDEIPAAVARELWRKVGDASSWP